MRILTLTELLEWFDPCYGEELEGGLGTHIKLAEAEWRRQSAWVQLQQGPLLLRGAGRNGRLPWESTAAIKGLKLATEVAVDGKVLGEVYAHQINAKTSGVSLVLLSTWSSLKLSKQRARCFFSFLDIAARS